MKNWMVTHSPSDGEICLNFTLALFLSTLIFWILFHTQNFNFDEVWEYRKVFWKGWLTTISLSCVSLILSTLIGLIAALLRRSNILIIRYLAVIYIEFIRGTPLLVQILFFYYIAAHAVGIENRFIVGVITLSMFSGAYISEMIRAGIENIRSSQLESAQSIGLTRFQTYLYVIFPQAIRQILPPLAGQFASLIKDSSLLSIIGISELTNTAQQVNSATYSTLESFLPLTFGYLVLTLPISLWSRYLERRYDYAN